MGWLQTQELDWDVVLVLVGVNLLVFVVLKFQVSSALKVAHLSSDSPVANWPPSRVYRWPVSRHSSTHSCVPVVLKN